MSYPEMLKREQNWIRLNEKRPVYPDTKWSPEKTVSYEEAQAVPHGTHDGVILTPDSSVIVIDFDAVRNPNGDQPLVHPQALAWLQECPDSYCTVSQTKTGFHLWLKNDGLLENRASDWTLDEWDDKPHQKADTQPHVEILGGVNTSALAMTSLKLPDAPEEIASAPEYLEELHSNFPEQTSASSPTTNTEVSSVGGGSRNVAELSDSNSRTAEGTHKTLEQFAEYGSGEVQELCERCLTLLRTEPTRNPENVQPTIEIEGESFNSPSVVDFHILLQLAYITEENGAVMYEVIENSTRGERPVKSKSDTYWVTQVENAIEWNERTLGSMSYCEVRE